MVLHHFDSSFIDAVVAGSERLTTITVPVNERWLHLDVNGVSLSSVVHDRSLS